MSSYLNPAYRPPETASAKASGARDAGAARPSSDATATRPRSASAPRPQSASSATSSRPPSKPSSAAAPAAAPGASATRRGAIDVRGLSLEQKLRRAFRAADTNGSRTVSKRELYRALEAVGISAFSSPEGLRLFNETDRACSAAHVQCCRPRPVLPPMR